MGSDGLPGADGPPGGLLPSPPPARVRRPNKRERRRIKYAREKEEAQEKAVFNRAAAALRNEIEGKKTVSVGAGRAMRGGRRLAARAPETTPNAGG